MAVSPRDRAILASAYELAQIDVDMDAGRVERWQGTEAELVSWLEARHGWTRTSEYAHHYVVALRTALQASV